MKKIMVLVFPAVFFLLLCCALQSIASEINKTHCKQWKRICSEEAHCIHRTGLRAGCYRCLRPAQKGFHLYLRPIDRSTCNIRTVEYLRTMGYHCYHPKDTEPCSRTPKSKYCTWQCVR